MGQKKVKTEEKGKNNQKELENEIQELAQVIDSLEDEKQDITNQLKHALADYQNLEKDVDKLIRLRYLQTKKNLARDIIPVMDSLAIAIKSQKDLDLDEKMKAWVDGISASIENFEKVLADMGLTKYIPEKGDRFDSDIHESVTTVNEGKKGLIYDTLQPGYRLDSMIIRPARVVVTK